MPRMLKSMKGPSLAAILLLLIVGMSCSTVPKTSQQAIGANPPGTLVVRDETMKALMDSQRQIQARMQDLENHISQIEKRIELIKQEMAPHLELLDGRLGAD